MIITCINCQKKFEIDQDLIPDDGRLLQCSSCNHKWFFKKKVDNKIEIQTKSSKDEIINKNLEKVLENREYKKNDDYEEKTTNIIKDNKTEKKNFKILNIMIVFLISFIALIILVDTFKYPISKIVPNIEFILYNLYETIKDIRLFLKDLI